MNFFKNMLSSEGKVSSKRFVTFVCLLFMLIGYTSNLFWDFTIDENLFQSLQWIVMAGLGFTAVEKNLLKKNQPQRLPLSPMNIIMMTKTSKKQKPLF